MAGRSFSVIVPTYTGEEYIGEVLQSILDQEGDHRYEVIVVIDGPKASLRSIAEKNQQAFRAKSIGFRIIQFRQNRGRFMARYEGAKAAEYEWLLFADDRNILARNYFKVIVDTREDIIIPNVIQENSPTPISRVLYLIRKKMYKQWGGDFDSYHITADNFEKSAKGTTGLWIRKDIFLDTCEHIVRDTEGDDYRHVNEDTKLFKGLIAKGQSIYRMSEAKVYYQSRVGAKKELNHLYERGPRFVDYYAQRGTRFFYPLMAFYFLLLFLLLLTFLFPKLFLISLTVGIALLMALAAVLARKPSDYFVVMIFLPIIIFAFGAGLVKGLVRKVRK